MLNRKTALQELTAKEVTVHPILLRTILFILFLQIATLEEELNNNTREEETFRTKEKALLDQLKQVRITTCTK